MQRVEPALDPTQSEHLSHMQRFGEALERMSSEISVLIMAAHKAMRGRRDYHGVRLSDRLQPCGKVGGLANCCMLLRHPLVHEIADHDDARGNADAHLERNTSNRNGYAIDDGEASAHCPFGIVFMRSWVPKISKHPIAKVLRHHAIEPLDLARAG